MDRYHKVPDEILCAYTEINGSAKCTIFQENETKRYYSKFVRRVSKIECLIKCDKLHRFRIEKKERYTKWEENIGEDL